VSRFIPAMTRYVVGLGQQTEDGKVIPVIFRKQATPMRIVPTAGLSSRETGSPYPAQNPLPR